VLSSRTLYRYSTTLSAGICGSFSFGGTPDYIKLYADLPSTSYTDATLVSGYCYYWKGRHHRRAGNLGWTGSTGLGIDTSSTAAPVLTPSAGTTSYWATDLSSPSSCFGSTATTQARW